MNTMNEYYEFVNIPLPYSFDALEPFIDQKTMELHHNRHLQTYIDNLNQILSQNPELQGYSLEELIINADQLPRKVRTPIKNNAGGVYNHRFFFQGLSNDSERNKDSALSKAIEGSAGSYENFMKTFKNAALSVFGSGYAWLAVNPKGNLEIVTTANQDSPIAYEYTPVLGIDVWEHAYYLKHYNKRNDYIDDWFQVINWSEAEKNYDTAMSNLRIS